MFLFLAGILGLVIGSFLNIVILRMPVALMNQSSSETFNLIVPRSYCPACTTPISLFDNIPVISYVLLKGRCRHCEISISKRYPLIELLSSALTVFTVYHFGLTLSCFFALFLVWSLIAISIIDFEHYIIPDDLNLPILWLGLLANYFSSFTTLEDAVLGAIFGYLSLWSVYWIFKLITKKEGMGYGDFKLLALLGAWLGWQALPWILFIASAVGSIVGISLILLKKQSQSIPLAFGPYLSLAGLIVLFTHPLLG